MIVEKMLISSLVKVFSDEKPVCNPLGHFLVLKNEKYSFQLAVCPEKDIQAKVKVDGIALELVSTFLVREIPSELPCYDDSDDYFLRREKGLFPDLLSPVGDTVSLEKDKWQSLWFEVSIPAGFKAGGYNLTVTVSYDGGEVSESVAMEVVNAVLPRQTLVNTNWYHSDCLCNYYGVEAMSEEYWRINENFIRTAVDHGINCILTPLFTPPLDTRVGGERRTVQLVGVHKSGGGYRFDLRNLKRWIEMCKRCGVEYFEMSHLFTQWGAKHAPKIVATDRKGREKKIFGWFTRTKSRKYDKFLREFAKVLMKFIEENGLTENCYFHVSDEPSMSHLKTYRRRAAFIREIFPGMKVIDALSDFEFYKLGVIENPVPATDHIDAFLGNVEGLWTYYCCGQHRHYVSNRFFAMPSERTRIIGYQLYKFNICGFLQWGYNFYNLQYSVKAIDPYEITAAGGAFPSGDSFVVYPAKDGTALPSLRLKVFHGALQDMRALQLLESLVGREKALAVLEEGLETPLTFREYPHSADWLLETRNRINEAIKNNI